MKIFIYVASNKAKDSLSQLYVHKLKEQISLLHDDTVEFYIRSPFNSNIQECIGCNNCFNKGQCNITDDMKDIKKEMLLSDCIIFVSPVYVHHVTGNMKIFIDRIGYWTHLMKLRGKFSMSVSVSSNNGNAFVNDYLDKVLMYLGTSNSKALALQSISLTDQILQSYVDVSAYRLLSDYKNKVFKKNREQESLFINLRNQYTEPEIKTVESEYWLSNNMLSYTSYEKLFYDNL